MYVCLNIYVCACVLIFTYIYNKLITYMCNKALTTHTYTHTHTHAHIKHRTHIHIPPYIYIYIYIRKFLMILDVIGSLVRLLFLAQGVFFLDIQIAM